MDLGVRKSLCTGSWMKLSILVASETDFRAEKEEVFGLWEKSSKQRAAVLEMWILGVVNRRGHESWPWFWSW